MPSSATFVEPPPEDPRERWPRASRRRLVLAMYLDVLFWSVPVALAVHYLREAGLIEGPPPWGVEWGALFAIELALVAIAGVRWLPGLRLLSITRVGRRTRGIVDPEIHRREHWVTMLVATFLVLEGTKAMVRWTMWTPPVPVFGHETTLEIWAPLSIALGVVNLYAAREIFLLRARGVWVALGSVTVSAMSFLASREHWPAWIETSVRRRRAFQGLGVRPGEIELLQRMWEPAFGVVVALLVAGLLASLLILRDADRTRSR